MQKFTFVVSVGFAADSSFALGEVLNVLNSNGVKVNDSIISEENQSVDVAFYATEVEMNTVFGLLSVEVVDSEITSVVVGVLLNEEGEADETEMTIVGIFENEREIEPCRGM